MGTTSSNPSKSTTPYQKIRLAASTVASPWNGIMKSDTSMSSCLDTIKSYYNDTNIHHQRSHSTHRILWHHANMEKQLKIHSQLTAIRCPGWLLKLSNLSRVIVELVKLVKLIKVDCRTCQTCQGWLLNLSNLSRLIVELVELVKGDCWTCWTCQGWFSNLSKADFWSCWGC